MQPPTFRANVRAAGLAQFQSNFAAGDHASIYSVAGKTSLEFTTNRQQLDLRNSFDTETSQY